MLLLTTVNILKKYNTLCSKHWTWVTIFLIKRLKLFVGENSIGTRSFFLFKQIIVIHHRRLTQLERRNMSLQNIYQILLLEKSHLCRKTDSTNREMVYFKCTSITSSYVQESFSHYKNIRLDNRRRLLSKIL